MQPNIAMYSMNPGAQERHQMSKSAQTSLNLETKVKWGGVVGHVLVNYEPQCFKSQDRHYYSSADTHHTTVMCGVWVTVTLLLLN